MNGSFALVRIKGPKSGSDNSSDRFVLPISTDGQTVIIGREFSCDFRIESIDVSRRHARLDLKDDNWEVTDLESTNGLYVNDIRLDQLVAHQLKNGDQLSFGPSSRSQFIYRFVDNQCPTLKRKSSGHKDKRFPAKKFRNEWKQLFDLELSCSICHELFVSPVNLNCAHTFCELCIEQWKNFPKKKKNLMEENSSQESKCCPICRQPIVSQNRVLTLDNVIDFIVQKWRPSLEDRRKQLIKERQSVSA